MGQKRSKGVTFWAWFFIIPNIWAFTNAATVTQDQIKMFGTGFFVFMLILSAVYIFTGFLLLKLKEIGRILAISLSVISIILLFFVFRQAFMSSNFDNFYAKQEKKIIEQTKPEYQQAKLDNFRKSMKVLPAIAFVIVGLPFLVIELLLVYFFTRPKVREQFRREVTSGDVG